MSANALKPRTYSCWWLWQRRFRFESADSRAADSPCGSNTRERRTNPLAHVWTSRHSRTQQQPRFQSGRVQPEPLARASSGFRSCRLTQARLVILAALVLLAASTLTAEQWPQWRGPMLNGVSGEKNLPVSWSTTENVTWKLAL